MIGPLCSDLIFITSSTTKQQSFICTDSSLQLCSMYGQIQYCQKTVLVYNQLFTDYCCATCQRLLNPTFLSTSPISNCCSASFGSNWVQCQNGGTCSNTNGLCRCQCPYYYYGAYCEYFYSPATTTIYEANCIGKF